MRFTFKFSNDFGEPVGSCVRCGAETRERTLVFFQAGRLPVFECLAFGLLLPALFARCIAPLLVFPRVHATGRLESQRPAGCRRERLSIREFFHLAGKQRRSPAAT